MTKGKIIGYIGITLIIIITVFLGTKYFIQTRNNKPTENTEIKKYSNLLCNKTISNEYYATINTIKMAFNNQELQWVQDVTIYYYNSEEEYINRKNQIELENTTKKIEYNEDNLVIREIYEGESNEITNNWSILVPSYDYDTLKNYLIRDSYICE